MNRKYLFRSNYKGICEIEGERLLGHLAFKTQDISWLDTSSPVVVLVSVNSAFHEKGEGFLKMEAFLATIRRHVKGEIVILIADTAHLYAQHLLEGPSATQSCLSAGEELVSRYRSLFAGSTLLYWHALRRDEAYEEIRSHILTLFHRDATFRQYLFEDADSAFTEKRKSEFLDKGQFIESTVADLIEQCVYLQLLARKQFRYLFYPGASCKATEYLRTILSNGLQWIDVFLTIEKKAKNLSLNQL